METSDELFDLVTGVTEHMYGGSLNHPAVAISAGGGWCPVQYTGWLTNGMHFYFRFRGGHASIRLGTDPDSAIRGTLGGYSMNWGVWPEGAFESDEERDWVFATLLRNALNNLPS